jgi:hypothetical protein
MIHAAKLVWNENNWFKPSGVAPNGVLVPIEKQYYYGLEEWLNNETLRKHKIGYLDCYRSNLRDGYTDIMLFTLNLLDRNIYHVCNICGVTQLVDDDIQDIKNVITNSWLTDTIDIDFTSIECMTPTRGMDIYKKNNWNSTRIISGPPSGFFVNIKYKKFELFDKTEWVNLTEMDSVINRTWRYLNVRYIIANAHFNDKLTSYLKNVHY